MKLRLSFKPLLRLLGKGKKHQCPDIEDKHGITTGNLTSRKFECEEYKNQRITDQINTNAPNTPTRTQNSVRQRPTSSSNRPANRSPRSTPRAGSAPGRVPRQPAGRSVNRRNAQRSVAPGTRQSTGPGRVRLSTEFMPRRDRAKAAEAKEMKKMMKEIEREKNFERIRKSELVRFFRRAGLYQYHNMMLQEKFMHGIEISFVNGLLAHY